MCSPAMRSEQALSVVLVEITQVDVAAKMSEIVSMCSDDALLGRR